MKRTHLNKDEWPESSMAEKVCAGIAITLVVGISIGAIILMLWSIE